MNAVLYILAALVAAGVAAAVTLTVLVIRGMREIDRAVATVFDKADEMQSQSNVRRLHASEVHRRVARARTRPRGSW